MLTAYSAAEPGTVVASAQLNATVLLLKEMPLPATPVRSTGVYWLLRLSRNTLPRILIELLVLST